MTRDQALSLKLTNTVYVINQLNEVQRKVTVGVIYKGDKDIQIWFADKITKFGDARVLSHTEVFLTEKDALMHKRSGLASQVSALKIKMQRLDEEIARAS